MADKPTPRTAQQPLTGQMFFTPHVTATTASSRDLPKEIAQITQELKQVRTRDWPDKQLIIAELIAASQLGIITGLQRQGDSHVWNIASPASDIAEQPGPAQALAVLIVTIEEMLGAKSYMVTAEPEMEAAVCRALLRANASLAKEYGARLEQPSQVFAAVADASDIDLVGRYGLRHDIQIVVNNGDSNSRQEESSPVEQKPSAKTLWYLEQQKSAYRLHWSVQERASEPLRLSVDVEQATDFDKGVLLSYAVAVNTTMSSQQQNLIPLLSLQFAKLMHGDAKDLLLKFSEALCERYGWEQKTENQLDLLNTIPESKAGTSCELCGNDLELYGTYAICADCGAVATR